MTMNKYFTAPSYDNWERVGEPYKAEGKMYTRVREKCWKCGGSGNYAWFGTCFSCGGSGYNSKNVRLYTEKERASLDRAAAKRAAAREAKKIDANLHAKERFCEAYGFDYETGITYMATGDTYAAKDTLKSMGFKYSSLLNWHGPKPAEIEGITFVEIEFDKVYVKNDNWFSEVENAKSYVDKIAYANVESISVHLGEVGERLKDLNVVVSNVRQFDGYYGTTTVYSFEDESGNKITWFSSKDKNIEIGDKVVLTGTIKKLDSYKGDNITILTRCKVA